MRLRLHPVYITKLFHNPQHDDIIDAVLVNDEGKIISTAPLTAVLNMIETRKMSLMNEKEVLDLLDILLGINYTRYGKTHAGNI